MVVWEQNGRMVSSDCFLPPVVEEARWSGVTVDDRGGVRNLGKRRSLKWLPGTVGR